MIRCLLTACLFVVLMQAASQSASAQQTQPTARPTSATAVSRTEIRQMPLLHRPDRPGHFYGNTVRRLHRRRSGGR